MLHRSIATILHIICLTSFPLLVTGLAFAPRRAFLVSTATALMTITPGAAKARLMLNEDGEYEEIEEGEWQSAWKERLDKAQGMTPAEVFRAAQGAGNMNLKQGPESEASKKRRAMAGCRDTEIRTKAGIDDPKECTARVLGGGDLDFILDTMS